MRSRDLTVLGVVIVVATVAGYVWLTMNQPPSAETRSVPIPPSSLVVPSSSPKQLSNDSAQDKQAGQSPNRVGSAAASALDQLHRLQLLTDGERRDEQYLEVFRNWGLYEPERAIQEAVLLLGEDSPVVRVLLKEYVSEDPTAAIYAAEHLLDDKLLRSSLLDELLLDWHELDSTALREFLSGRPDLVSQEVTMHIAMSLFDEDPAAALDWTTDFGTGHTVVLSSLVHRYAQTDYQSASDYVDRIADEKVRAALLIAFAREAANLSEGVDVGWLREHQDEVFYQDVEREFVVQWGRRDTSAALEFLLVEEKSEAHPGLITSLLQSSTMRAPERAGQLLAKIKDSNRRDELAASIAQMLAKDHWSESMDVINGIQDERRQRVSRINAIFNAYGTDLNEVDSQLWRFGLEDDPYARKLRKERQPGP